MVYGLTLASEVVIAFIAGILSQDFFIATAITVMSTFIVYNLWDEFFIRIKKESNQ